MAQIFDKYLNAIRNDGHVRPSQDRPVLLLPAPVGGYDYKAEVTNRMKIHFPGNETDETPDGIFGKGKTKTIHTHDAEGYEEFFHIFHTRIVSAKIAPKPPRARCQAALHRAVPVENGYSASAPLPSLLTPPQPGCGHQGG